jgi:O-antigen ligase
LGYPPIIESFYSVLNIQGDFLTENAARTGNFIIYSYSIENDVLFERNCGFAWEPGAYSCFCLIALLINVLMMNKKKSIVNTILLLALVTTRSTTGYVLLFISVFLVLFFNVKSQAKYLLVIFMIVISIIVWNLDFVGEKMSDQFNMAEIDRIETLIDWSIEYDTTYYLSRFDSFLLAMMDFSSHPIFGYGGNTSLQYSTTQGANVVTISGIGTLLARYGIYGFIGWIYLLCKSGQFYNSHKNKSLGGNMLVIWFFLNIGIAISYLLILSPVFFILYFFPFFSEEEQSATKPSDASSADSVLDPAS